MKSSFGGVLKSLRSSRRVSQLQLSLDAEVSTRHLSFLETGRASPSREMVLVLGSALDLTLRDRNLLLEAAGFTPAYRETAHDSPEMAELRHALELILQAHEPFPAVVLDRHWNVVTANRGFSRVAAVLLSMELVPYVVLPPAQRPNLVRTLAFDLKPVVLNWADVMSDLLPRIERDAPNDEVVSALLEELRRVPELSAAEVPPLPRAPLVLPVELAVGDVRARLFTTITTLGTAQDVTTQELRIEAFHPADAASREVLLPLLTS